MLEQIKEELADIFTDNYEEINNDEVSWQLADEIFKSGFDACINLELPIKFADYLFTVKFDSSGKYINMSTKELFNYWLNNVYEN